MGFDRGNQPVDPQRLGQALGPDTVQRLSAGSGIDIAALLPMLAMFLPQIIDMLTPDGTTPAGWRGRAAGRCRPGRTARRAAGGGPARCAAGRPGRLVSTTSSGASAATGAEPGGRPGEPAHDPR